MSDAAVHLDLPRGTPVPLVVDSPHSGLVYPPDFHPTASRDAIRTTWDAHVESLWGAAPEVGATFLHALFPRAYIDVNRAEDDLDPAVLASTWPTPVAPTDYSRRGMGLVRRLALPDVPMYDAPLSIAAVEHRLATCYRPYRRALHDAVEHLRDTFGLVWHINCHSMKSRGNAMNVDAGAMRPDLVISDRHGTTADPVHAEWLVAWWQARGFRVQRNDPYQGGDLVRTIGRPAAGVHSLQIEINRALYLDEARAEPGAGFAEMQQHCRACLVDVATHLRTLVTASR